MPAQTLAAALVITGKDGGISRLVDAVAGKIDKLVRAGKRVDGVGRGFDEFGRAVDRADRKVERLHNSMKKVDTLGHRLKSTMVDAVGAIGLANSTKTLIDKTARASAEGAHERVRMRAAGMTPA